MIKLYTYSPSNMPEDVNEAIDSGEIVDQLELVRYNEMVVTKPNGRIITIHNASQKNVAARLSFAMVGETIRVAEHTIVVSAWK